MVIEITMPQLGESVTEGTISKWLVKQGDYVNKFDPIAEVLTDKVTAEIPSSYSGTIKEIIAQEDETIAVGKVICTMETSDQVEVNKKESKPSEPKSLPQRSEKQRYSPAVLKLAQEHQIDLQKINGTGLGGRITRKDVLAYIESLAQTPHPHEEQKVVTKEEINEQPITHIERGNGDILIPVTPVRRAIATNMVKSKHEIPHAWMMVEADVTNLVKLRNKVKDAFYEREGYPLTFLPFFIKAVVEGLKKYPMINSVWKDDTIVQKKDIHISIAVATEDALFVPVIKNADEKTIKAIAKDIHELARKVREGKIQPSEMQGGTFTVNNTGSFGSVLSAPIINYPQAAILSVESIVKRPVVIDDMIAIRSMVNLCLSLDHRILDGLVCGKFLSYVKNRLETMTEETVAIY